MKTKSLPIRQTGFPDFARDTLSKWASISHSRSAQLNELSPGGQLAHSHALISVQNTAFLS
jgi:hypothetical protein